MSLKDLPSATSPGSWQGLGGEEEGDGTREDVARNAPQVAEPPLLSFRSIFPKPTLTVLLPQFKPCRCFPHLLGPRFKCLPLPHLLPSLMPPSLLLPCSALVALASSRLRVGLAPSHQSITAGAVPSAGNTLCPPLSLGPVNTLPSSQCTSTSSRKPSPTPHLGRAPPLGPGYTSQPVTLYIYLLAVCPASASPGWQVPRWFYSSLDPLLPAQASETTQCSRSTS